MIGGAGGIRGRSAAPATVLKMLYCSGGALGWYAPDPFGIGLYAGTRGGRRRSTMGAVLAARDSDFPISGIAFH